MNDITVTVAYYVPSESTNHPPFTGTFLCQYVGVRDLYCNIIVLSSFTKVIHTSYQSGDTVVLHAKEPPHPYLPGPNRPVPSVAAIEPSFDVPSSLPHSTHKGHWSALSWNERTNERPCELHTTLPFLLLPLSSLRAAILLEYSWQPLYKYIMQYHQHILSRMPFI